jgi:CHAD domain-containing protein/adenylate cyclase class IV
MTRTPEIELKLNAGPDAFQAVLDWLRDQAGFQPSEPSVTVLDDTYYDTPDRWFLRAGAALRLRRTDESAEISLKALDPPRGGIATRLEIKGPLARRPPGRIRRIPAGPIREYLDACGAPLTVRPLFRLWTERTVVHCSDASGARLEACCDRAELDAPGRGRDTFDEIEIEHCAGNEVRHAGLMRALARSLGLDPSQSSKFQRGLSLLPPHENPDTGPLSGPPPPARLADLARPGVRLVDTAYEVLRFHYDEMLRNEPGTRLGIDIERLHDMRVASRRLRTALRVFEHALPAARKAAFEKELRWITDALGPVRDLDVYLASLASHARDIAPDDVPHLADYRHVIEERRERARRTMLDALDSARYGRFKDRFRRWLNRGAPNRPRAPLAAAPVEQGAARLLLDVRDTVLKRGKRARKKTTVRRLHRLRIACKRLRYTCEWFSALYGKPYRKYIKAVRDLQDLTGDHHDAVVGSEQIRHVVHENGNIPATIVLAMGQVLAEKREIIAQTEAAFPKAWKRFTRKKTQARLLDCLARPAELPGQGASGQATQSTDAADLTPPPRPANGTA